MSVTKIDKALGLLRRADARLVRLHANNGTGGFYIWPRGGRVSDEVAQLLLERSDVQPFDSELFPEREMIAQRTREALAAAKARGVKLGNPRLAEARAGVTAARIAAADAFAANVRPIIREIQKSGVTSLRGVAKALSARGIKTARGGEWTAVQVSDILERSGDRPFEAGAAAAQ